MSSSDHCITVYHCSASIFGYYLRVCFILCDSQCMCIRILYTYVCLLCHAHSASFQPLHQFTVIAVNCWLMLSHICHAGDVWFSSNFRFKGKHVWLWWCLFVKIWSANIASMQSRKRFLEFLPYEFDLCFYLLSLSLLLLFK